VKALIVAGGFGTRLRPLTDRVPKSLLPIANRPFLEHQIRLLAAHGVNAATLLTGYLPEDFGPFGEQMRAFGVTVDVSTEREPLGTAGAVRSCLDQLDGTTIVFNGDVLTEIEVGALIDFHRQRAAVVTIALTPVEDASAYGLVTLDASNRVQAFLEKPTGEAAKGGGLINAGIYVIEPRALERIPSDMAWSFETQLFPSLLQDGEPVYGFPSDAYWLDIGTPERYLQAHYDVLQGRARAAVDGRMVTEDVSLPDGTRVLGPCLLSHAPVGPGATLGPLTCLGPGVRIGAGAVVERSVLHAGVVVGENAIVRRSILGRDVVIEPGTECVDDVRA
jgi:mannose-1-phosphate guanylyltransferase